MCLTLRGVVSVGAMVLVAAAGGVCRGAELYVNNVLGNDVLNGRSAEVVNETTGPVRSINRAARLAGRGDTIIVANTGTVYLESIQLGGVAKSGLGTIPLTILGNGAIVDGSAPVLPAGWRHIGGPLWQVTPLRKGHYQLLLEDRPLPEHRIPTEAAVLPTIPEGHWSAWRGSIVFHVPGGNDPARLPLRLAVQGTGLSLYAVHNVVIRDLTFRYFRLDGVSANDLCRGVVLENVHCLGNGRAGATVAGSSQLILRNCELRGNLRHSLLVTETATADVTTSLLDQPPTIAE